MTFDPATLHLLQHQGRRMQYALHQETPPNRKEAEAIQVRVDDILDRRPRPVAVTKHGDIVYDGDSPWVLAQAAETAEFTTAIPDALPDAAKPIPFDPEHGGHPDPPAGTASGGVGLMEPPKPPVFRNPTEPLSDADEAKIAEYRKELGL